MSQVLVMSDDPRLEESVRVAGLKVARVRPADLGQTGKDRSPGALVLDARGQNQLPAGLGAFRKQHPGSGVVLVTSTLDPRLMLEAMRAGVTECVHEPITPEALLDAVRRVLVNAAPDQLGQLMAFVGVKGGVGTTTLAVNTGIALARASGGEVLLIDMHIGHGDAAVLLGVEPRFSVLDALENVHRVDESFFKGLVEKSKAGLELLGCSDRILRGPSTRGGCTRCSISRRASTATRCWTFRVRTWRRSTYWNPRWSCSSPTRRFRRSAPRAASARRCVPATAPPE